MKTQWRKMESWEPLEAAIASPAWIVHRYNGTETLRRSSRKWRYYKTRATALRAANKQNDLEGLPRVS